MKCYAKNCRSHAKVRNYQIFNAVLNQIVIGLSLCDRHAFPLLHAQVSCDNLEEKKTKDGEK